MTLAAMNFAVEAKPEDENTGSRGSHQPKAIDGFAAMQRDNP